MRVLAQQPPVRRLDKDTVAVQRAQEPWLRVEMQPRFTKRGAGERRGAFHALGQRAGLRARPQHVAQNLLVHLGTPGQATGPHFGSDECARRLGREQQLQPVGARNAGRCRHLPVPLGEAFVRVRGVAFALRGCLRRPNCSGCRAPFGSIDSIARCLHRRRHGRKIVKVEQRGRGMGRWRRSVGRGEVRGIPSR